MDTFYSIDVETTSKYPTSARMLSFGAVKFTKQGKEISHATSVKEIYFSSLGEVPSDAARVNGLSRSLLHELSGGKFLADQYDELQEFLYSGANLIGYNIEKYDLPVIISNVMNEGWDRPKIGKVVDVLPMARNRWTTQELGGHRTLVNCFNRMIKEQGSSLKAYEGLFQFATRKSPVAAAAHHAGWDSFMTLHLYRYLVA